MIQISNLVKIYNKGKQNECKALNGISLTITDGESLAIMGKSGSGKSTLLNILCGIENATSGSIMVDGKDITRCSDTSLARYRANNIGVIMQDFQVIDIATCLENVTLPYLFTKTPSKVMKVKGKELLKKVGLERYITKRAGQLSGGEKQRVAIARAIATNPNFIFADEPTGALDSKTADEILDLLLDINKQGKTLIIVTHDINIAEKCSKIVRLADGQFID